MKFYPFFRVFVLLIIHISLGLSAAPHIIAHRGGGQNFPENTILAFCQSMELGCDGIELDVQATKDDVVVVYHPHDLNVRTEGSGTIASKNWNEIAVLDAGYHFEPENNYPYRAKGLTIPRLTDVLKIFPKTLIVIDLKSSEHKKLLHALIKTITNEEAEHLIFYSTDSAPIDWLNKHKPNWKTFETRDHTRLRLLELNQGHVMSIPLSTAWIGFELKRAMSVREMFTLGEGVSRVEFKLWKPKVISELRNACCAPKLVLFGINTEEDWEEAIQLDVDMVYTDNPKRILGYAAATCLVEHH